MSGEKGSGGTDVGKTAAGVALGILSVPVIITVVAIVLVIGLCVLCSVMGGVIQMLNP